ncbi:MAG TPA: S8 family serine peptidase [Rhodocyclaceae bacterium]|nr:S8 family serine peptidase [Rhodocyclaceae bacterium]
MTSFSFRQAPPAAQLALALCLLAGGAAHAQHSHTERVIVQYRDHAGQLAKQAQGAERGTALGTRLGLSLATRDGPAPGSEIVSAPGMDAEHLAAALAADPDVLFAVPDRRKQIRRMPNDPRYAEQWLLQQGAQPASIDAETAWDLTTGSRDVVVAVVDTGVRFDHEDLAGVLLPGYDFIADAVNAGDGDGRDADASDPGDFLSAEDLQKPEFSGCGDGFSGNLPISSSWHGTRVAGVIGAIGNNSRGVAGVSWETSIVPVRALGKCGGWDSDIVAAMRWAGGLAVPGAPANPRPAKIVNLSLGGEGSCSALYRDAIAELNAAGVTVVAAAGNSIAVQEPGNCPGVVSVAGLRHAGTKVGYSSHGPEVAIAAPAGNCYSEGFVIPAPCGFQIPTTTNLGTTHPGANGYSDALNATVGTSFSAPLVAGTAALMLAVHPELGPNAVLQRLQSTARAFPVEAGLPVCPQRDILSGQCNCTTTTCGAGMLAVPGAVGEALRPFAAPRQTGTESAISLDGAASSASGGSRVTSWQWQMIDGPGAAVFAQPQAAITALQAPQPGVYRVSLTVGDDAGRTDSSTLQVTVSEAAVVKPPEPPPPPRKGGGGAVDAGGVAGLLVLAWAALQARRRRDRSVSPVATPPMKP